MNTLVGSKMVQFGDFRFDRHTRKLTRQNAAGEWEPVALGSRPSVVLAVLTDKPGEVVSRDAIMDAVWPGVAVEPNNMTVQMAALRLVLDNGSVASCIQTVSGRGYRIVCPLTHAEHAQPTPVLEPIADPILADTPPPRRRPRWRVLTEGSVITDAVLTAANKRDPQKPA